MKEEFQSGVFRFVRFYCDFTDDLDPIINSKESKGKVNSKKYNLELSFEKKDNKITVSFNNKKFEIDSVPIIFQNENNECLFKIYHFLDSNKMENIFETIKRDYDFYLPNNQRITFEKIKEGDNKLITLKKKEDQYNDIFKPLCRRLSKTEKSLTIKTNNLLPEKSVSLSLNSNSDFRIIIDSRLSLINRIDDFVRNENKYILKMYGSDGIGKSITLLYYMSLETKYKMIYFNLKDIFIKGSDPYIYFQNALMKFFSTYPNDLDTMNQKEKEENEKNKCNYELYLKFIENLKTNSKKHINNNFWDLLNIFCTMIRYDPNSIIIIDQYKSEYDKEEQINKLNKLLSEYGEKQFIKFIVASSLNDDSVKEDLRDDLILIYGDIIEQKIFLTKQKETANIEVEDELFEDFNLDQTNNEMIIDDDFSKISMFNIVDDNELENPEIKNTQIKDNDNKINPENKSEKENNLFIPVKKDISKYDIVYVNNLVSIEEIVKDSNDKEIFRLFDFNPKTYIKFNTLLQYHPSSLSNDKYKSFLDLRFNNIDVKIDLFYRKLKNIKKYSNYSPESLKGTFLMMLKEIIKTKKKLNLMELIQYLEVFPFKYIKIYLAEDDTVKKENIISLNEDLKDSHFILEYSYEFVEIAFSKILSLIPSNTLIDMKNLTGSGIGSLLENKIKRNLEENGFIIKYFWNFTSKSDTIKKNEKDYVYDYNTYKKIKFLYDNEIEGNIELDYNKSYYIVPGSETNRSLDSVILQPSKNNSFDLIFCQITKFKNETKKKSQYIKDCFLAKKKFETKYKIKINKIYFYFILAKDFVNEKTKEDLESKGIDYFHYSILEDKFYKNEMIYNLDHLNELEAEIFDDTQDEYLYFNSKLTLINCLEKYLQKKRRSDKNFLITKNKFESARKHLIKKSPNIILDKENKKQIDNILKNHHIKYNSELIYKYIFSIAPREFIHFSDEENIIGILIHYDNKIPAEKVYKYFYKGRIFPVGLIPSNIFENNYLNLKNNLPKDKDCLISEIPEQYWDKIYVFRIYNGLFTEKAKKRK